MTDLTEILAGSPATTHALAGSDTETWQLLLEHVVAGESKAAPGVLVAAMLALDPDVEAWMRRAKNRAAVIDSALFTRIVQATKPFRAWFLAGVRGHCAPDSPAAIAARFEALLGSTDDDAFEQTRAFVADLAGRAPSHRLRPRALMLLARRAIERGMPDAAETAASDAESLFAATGSRKDVTHAMRMRGAALLKQRRFAEAFALLDPVLAEPGPLFGGEGTQVFHAQEDPREDALDELATIAIWATHTTPEWVRALGCLAETHGTDPSLRERFEQALAAMVANHRASRVQADLEVVIRQSLERGMEQTARAAEQWLPARDIAPRSLQGARLILRLQTRKGSWLRIHDNGELELTQGDARRDLAREPMPALRLEARLLESTRALHDRLLVDLEDRDLSAASPWQHHYAVQAFAGPWNLFVEGSIGVEIEMGRVTAIHGLRDSTDAASSLDTIRKLLACVVSA